MIIVPNEYTFVATPRTGSRAVVEALIELHPNAMTDYPRDHHTHPEDVPRDLPIYTVVRNPVQQMLSWWYHVDKHTGLRTRPVDFAKSYGHPQFLPRDNEYKLNIYADIADKFIPYTKDFRFVKKELGIQPPVIGASKYRVADEEVNALADYLNGAFSSDMRLWRDCICQSTL